MHHGSCLCGAVRYRLEGDLGAIVFCHCRQCRKAQGSAFASNAPVSSADFCIVSGESHIKKYESSPGKVRAFCAECGSPIYSQRTDRPDQLRLRLGTLDTPVDERPTAHIFAGSRAEWFEIADDLPRHDGIEPERR